jgi:hypothetical protein
VVAAAIHADWPGGKIPHEFTRWLKSNLASHNRPRILVPFSKFVFLQNGKPDRKKIIHDANKKLTNTALNELY